MRNSRSIDHLVAMIITVKVKPGSRKEGIELANDVIVVRVNAPPVEGRANEALIRLLSKLLDVPKSQIAILGGTTSRFKRVEIPTQAYAKLQTLLGNKV